jgi:hypothetical protein
LIDLHTHTTASDGRLSPVDLVARAVSAGVTVLGVTDHDTLASCPAVAAASAASGIDFVPGIEVTAVEQGGDVHVLGYFMDVDSAPLQSFLTGQRRLRAVRVRAIVERLGTLGLALDADAILAPSLADPSRAPGRPWIARALVAAGHAASPGEAFDRWIGRGRPAFVPRTGADPVEVVRRVHDAGGIASLAHPILVGPQGEADKAAWIASLAEGGLDAIEAFHTEQDAAATARYLELAARLGLEVSGGSDFHGDPQHGPAAPGAVSLPPDRFDRLKLRWQSGQN